MLSSELLKLAFWFAKVLLYSLKLVLLFTLYYILVQRTQISSFGLLLEADPPHPPYLGLLHVRVCLRLAPKVLQRVLNSRVICLMTMEEWNLVVTLRH